MQVVLGLMMVTGAGNSVAKHWGVMLHDYGDLR